MTTMIDKPAGSLGRRDVEVFLDWLEQMPVGLTPADAAPLASKILGHPVAGSLLREAVDAVTIRDAYRGSEAELDAQQQRVDMAFAALMDARTPAQRVQDYAERTHDENPFTVAVEAGEFVGHAVNVSDLCDLAALLDDLAHSEDHQEETLRQEYVDRATAKILNGRLCAVAS